MMVAGRSRYRSATTSAAASPARWLRQQRTQTSLRPIAEARGRVHAASSFRIPNSGPMAREDAPVARGTHAAPTTPCPALPRKTCAVISRRLAVASGRVAATTPRRGDGGRMGVGKNGACRPLTQPGDRDKKGGKNSVTPLRRWRRARKVSAGSQPTSSWIFSCRSPSRSAPSEPERSPMTSPCRSLTDWAQ